MSLNLLNGLVNNLKGNNIVKDFIKELEETLQNYNNKDLGDRNMDDIELTAEEELEFDRKKFEFLENFFEKELANLSEKEAFIVTNKYENDIENQRYKVAQYKDGFEYKYVAFEKDLPTNVKLGDVVRKIDGHYIYDAQATKYVGDAINKIKEEIIRNRI